MDGSAFFLNPNMTVVGDLRLVGSNGPRGGRLEVYYNYQWGTVCNDHFDVVSARVACRQLMYRYVISGSHILSNLKYICEIGLSMNYINLLS